MIRRTWIVLAAGVLVATNPGWALAGIVTFSNTAFTSAQTTNFDAITGNKTLPYTDSFGTTITPNAGTSGFINNGLYISAPPGNVTTGIINVTFALANPTNQIGFNLARYSIQDEYLLSATFSNGDVFTGGPSFLVGGRFLNFSDTQAFTSVTLRLTGGSFILVSDLRVGPSAASVAEPSTLSMAGLGVAVACVLAHRLRKLTR